jgi:hypothetical protein
MYIIEFGEERRLKHNLKMRLNISALFVLVGKIRDTYKTFCTRNNDSAVTAAELYIAYN